MNLKHDLQTEPITHIDLSFYVEVEMGMPVRDVIEKMQASHRKCALVMDRGRMIGIFTERDILKKTVSGHGARERPIEELMTPDPETAGADLTIIRALQLVIAKPYRYMPVLNRNKIVIGTLTHYALIKYISDHFPEEVYNLPPVPDRFAEHRDGA